MKKLLLSVCAFSLTLATLQAGEITKYVNPFIGTGAIDGGLSGNNYPGATSPFGMIQLSPDTSEAPNWGDASGYDYNRNTIFGFSHTRLSGTGASDLIDITLMPTSSGRTSSAFTHDAEKARPGYYQVMLKDENINAELTTTQRNGIHRYQYPAGKDAEIILDMDHSADKGSWGRRIINSQIRILNDHAVEGYRIITGWAKLRKIYFYMEFSSPILTSTLRDGGRVHENTAVINGTNLHGCFRFGQLNGKPLTCKVALSSVSMENARQNMEQEAPHWDFDRYVAAADADWEKQLGKIEVKGTEVQKEIFYTALYHTMIQPNTMSDVNGEYMAADYTTRKVANNETHYTTFSLWDTFRALHPLMTIIDPNLNNQFINSLIRKHQEGGIYPMWDLASNYTGTMIGYHAVPVIVDAYMKGYRNFDAHEAYKASLRAAEYDTTGIKCPDLVLPHLMPKAKYYKNAIGYIPCDRENESVAKALEYAYDDWCISIFAEAMNDFENKAKYERFAKAYEFYFDKSTRFMRGLDSNGEWRTPFNPRASTHRSDDYCEGTAWQWTWFVPHDVEGLVKLMGGEEAFVEKLDSLFTVDSSLDGETTSADISGLIGQYAHGNEPSHHVIHLYNYVNRPWRTQELVDSVYRSQYANNVDGLSGNEDCGQMSAWYILNSMGFYQVCPGKPVYSIGRPAFDKAVINLPSEKTFSIVVKNNSKSNKYIESVLLNGKPLDTPFFGHQDIVAGGIMEIKMTDHPTQWGSNNSPQ